MSHVFDAVVIRGLNWTQGKLRKKFERDNTESEQKSFIFEEKNE